MKDLHESSNRTRELYKIASSILDYDLWELTLSDPSEKLNDTVYTQPAMLVAGVASWESYISRFDLLPKFMAGHSLGEYTALVCSGVINFTDAVKIVQTRAKYMAEAVPSNLGAMAAIIGSTDKGVIDLCDFARDNEILSAVNFNAPGQVVIAGNKSAVKRAIDHSREFGAKRAMMLNVSVPSHCKLMDEASIKLKNLLNTIHFNPFTIPVIKNIDARVYNDKAELVEGLSAQMREPVQWTETIKFITNTGIKKFIEYGPGGILCGLNKRIDRSISSFKLDSIDAHELINDEFS
jgi:[acyl-carrier-protein] S-malonyltransferase